MTMKHDKRRTVLTDAGDAKVEVPVFHLSREVSRSNCSAASETVQSFRPKLAYRIFGLETRGFPWSVFLKKKKKKSKLLHAFKTKRKSDQPSSKNDIRFAQSYTKQPEKLLQLHISLVAVESRNPAIHHGGVLA